ncbi:amidohydrolase [Actinomadura graeca]|uniref:Amidohydrolase n=1 Tax=Actinomadura graeca TaxID=2750812 RepID=A0ABX8QR55_9ACTN|nr:amidohydrolase [Actinomadura graeca]QXJ21280.1 amidohydrolase [Actinomadura graeca]
MAPGTEPPHPLRLVSARRVVTMTGADRSGPQGLVCLGDRIIAVGDRAGLAARFPRAARTDFGDAVIVPGFNDAHMHPSLVAEDALHADLSPGRITSPEELAAALRAQAARTPEGAWVRASGYDHGKTTGGRIIDRHDLDRICPAHPALVIHVACHWAVANSAALAAGGLDDDSADPPGGGLGRDPAGHLNGILYEQAMFDYAVAAMARGGTPIIPPSGPADRRRALRGVLTSLNAVGITSAGDLLVGPDAIETYQEAQRHGELPVRLNLMVAHPHFDALRGLGLRSGFGGDRLRLNGVKAFVDGAIGGGTALLAEPYEGRAHDHGQQVLTSRELNDLVRAVHAADTRIAVHANGDRAVDLLLDAYEGAQSADPRPHLRHRIEHCTVVTEDIVRRIKRLDAVVVPFASYVGYHGDKLPGWYGGRRLERMFAHRWFLDAGITVAGASDHPCAPPDPLLGIQSCVTRTAADGAVLGGNQRISPREALRLYTVGAAEASDEAAVKGRLAPGHLADFTVLGDDPLAVDPRTIACIPVLATWVGGEQVWSAS